MNLLKAFDLALAELEGLPNGYLVGKRFFDSYLRNDAWEAFLAAMKPLHRLQFEGGSGGELEEKRGRPPKMASFASSSRMIYQLSKHIDGFCFEKQLPTTVGGRANLDGYLSLPDKEIYIEAKCREPYSHTAEQIISRQYRGVYDHLCRQMPDIFFCTMQNMPDVDNRSMHVSFRCKGKTVEAFDIKQMICHLLAVATEHLTRPGSKGVLFLYLLYDPSQLPLQSDDRQTVLAIHKDVCQTATELDLPQMFAHIVDYLMAEGGFPAQPHEAEALKKAFRFRLCDQNDYLLCLQ